MTDIFSMYDTILAEAKKADAEVKTAGTVEVSFDDSNNASFKVIGLGSTQEFAVLSWLALYSEPVVKAVKAEGKAVKTIDGLEITFLRAEKTLQDEVEKQK